MEEELKAYRDYISQAVAAWAALDAASREAERARLQRLHERRLADFQHERLLHLLVTLFFGIVLVALFLTALTCGASLAVTVGMWPTTLLGVLTLVVLVLEAFYIKHYYFLENNVQALYRLVRPLYQP
ncbi:MAG: hypothetical protein LBT74_07235 [Acidobacteriota bacterium]|jgi:fatty-acid desaturase|nr:hypothetical protein [Acidobacteriota bacterium]